MRYILFMYLTYHRSYSYFCDLCFKKTDFFARHCTYVKLDQVCLKSVVQCCNFVKIWWKTNIKIFGSKKTTPLWFCKLLIGGFKIAPQMSHTKSPTPWLSYKWKCKTSEEWNCFSQPLWLHLKLNQKFK